jgi:hypothetical protein
VLLQGALQTLARLLKLASESFDLLFQLNELFFRNFPRFHDFVGGAIRLSRNGADSLCSPAKLRLPGHSIPPI